jgi:ADP-ribose pyrophosphatase YjhB (NUDIX family)
MSNLEIKITALILRDEKVLLIKEKNTDDGKYYWNLIKGTFEPKRDKGILNIVVRECQEEVNIGVAINNLINVIYYRKKDKIRLQFNFVCSAKNGNPVLSHHHEQVSRGEDIIAIKLFTKEQLTLMKKSEFMNERIYLIVHDFLAGKMNDLSVLKEIIEL